MSAKSLLDLRNDDPRLHDTTSDLLAPAVVAGAETEVEAEVELVTREDRERCPTSPSHVGALRLILGQLEVAYRTIDVAVKEAIAGAVDSQPRRFSHWHGPMPSRVVVVVASGFYLAARLHFSQQPATQIGCS